MRNILYHKVVVNMSHTTKLYRQKTAFTHNDHKVIWQLIGVTMDKNMNSAEDTQDKYLRKSLD